MRIPLKYRHPFRWRKCKRAATTLEEEKEYGIQFTPGQIYTLKYGVRK